MMMVLLHPTTSNSKVISTFLNLQRYGQQNRGIKNFVIGTLHLHSISSTSKGYQAAEEDAMVIHSTYGNGKILHADNRYFTLHDMDKKLEMVYTLFP